MLTVYIAGPMSGHDEHNFPAFFAAAAEWQKAGWTVYNPAELDGENTEEAWKYYLKRDLKLVVDADAIATLPGWQQSRGATLEVHVARALGIPQFDALHPARVAWHPFEDKNACCTLPDYCHEPVWSQHHV